MIDWRENKVTKSELIELLNKYDDDLNIVVAVRTIDDFWDVDNIIVNENGDLQLIF